MPTTVQATDGFQQASLASIARRALIGAYLVAVAAACGLLVINGPTMRAAAEAEQTRIIDAENKRICEKLGMPHGMAGFTLCAEHLQEVRKLHGERLGREAAGLL